ncbi:replicative DNA helicase [Paraclostridium bifermentans]|uniref:replicative DNA helicase n=1 Tax=Paraclostridium bifermentans TaxID=1490 RepID=UPI00242D4D91|nr:DnaB-like helicase C-terminal domain-containing protein [Paraclostridium bifermentans]
MITNESETIEQEILGGVINDNTLISMCRENIKTEMFKLERHREIYRTINKMIDEGLTVDSINLIKYSERDTAKMGGVAYITDVASCNVSNANFESKLKFLIADYNKQVLLKAVKEMYNHKTVEEMTETLRTGIEKVLECNITNDIDICEEYEEYLQDLYKENQEEGFKTDLYNLDEALGDLQRGRLITIFARSGVGKSTFAIQMALNLALNKHKVIYASGEMSRREVFNKIMASHFNINYFDLNKKNISEDTKNKISSFSSVLINSCFHITNETDINKLFSEIKLYKLKFGLDIVFIDYVNKYIRNSKGLTLTEKIGQVTSQLKDLALKENICIVMLAQANRKVDNNGNEAITDKLSSSDIQDSARIEQDSDQIIALYRNLKLDNKQYREEQHNNNEIDMNSQIADKNPYCINATITKNRHGEKKTLAFKWDGAKSKVSNWL